MIAAWPGMGNVALGTVDYIRRKLKAVRFAEIKTDPLAALDAVEVKGGLSKLPKTPLSTFYYIKDPEIILFEGEVQPAGRNGIELLNKVLGVAADLKVSRIFTGAAFPMPVSYKDASEIYGAANKESLRDYLKDYGIRLMERGHISGLNGLMLGFAAKKGIDAICLLATMPHYAISLPNPKSSSAIIEALNRMLNISIDVRELKGYIEEMEERMAVIEDKVKDVITIEEEPIESYPHHEKKVPGYIMERIERLFVEAKEDRNKASSLKSELDRWNLYSLYEDRFLDLFKENQ
jgi:proteasome assembly chaperone (PAC2) family protein